MTYAYLKKTSVMRDSSTKLPKTSAYVGLRINVQKTKFCSNNPNAKFTVKNELLERVDEFTFLGSRIALNGSVTSEVKARIGKAVGAFASLIPI